MKNKRRLVLLLLVAIVTPVGYFAWLFFIRDSNRAYFVEHSGIQLPFFTTNTAHFTGFEFALTSHYTLPKSARENFAKLNGFSPSAPSGWEPIFHLQNLQTPWNQLPPSGTFYYRTGADAYTAWDAVYHLESGNLWTTIYFADFSGDLPARALNFRLPRSSK